MMKRKLCGLIAAVHTPFAADGSLRLDVVEGQAEYLQSSGVHAVFVCGTTGESHSLTVDERMKLAARWLAIAQGTELKVVVHVGANCLADAAALARHAEGHGAAAIGAMAPSYFKPDSVESLVACCASRSGSAIDGFLLLPHSGVDGDFTAHVRVPKRGGGDPQSRQRKVHRSRSR